MRKLVFLSHPKAIIVARFAVAGTFIFTTELLLMWLSARWPTNDPTVAPLFNAFSMTIISTVVFYIFFYKPLVKERIDNVNIKRLFDRSRVYDQLTELPNSLLFIEKLNHEIQNSDRTQRPFALILIRIHHLSEINGSMGHKRGDDALITIAHRLKQGLRKSDTISRYDGNVFCLLLPGVDERFAYIVSRKLQLLLEEKIVLDEIEVSVETSGGIVLYPQVRAGDHELILFADVASRRDRIGHNRYHIYDLKTNERANRQLKIYSLLKEAVLQESGITLQYQPKINIKTGAIESVEALARWQNSELGSISPVEFIPVAERTALIRPFTWKIIETALNDIVYWRDHGIKVRVAVNLSAHNLYDPQLTDKLPELLLQRSISSELLELEITESALLEDREKTLEALSKLKDSGFSLTIDDFGTGYSSLAYLCDLPVDYLKIDQSFVKEICIHQSNKHVVQFTVDLAHSLNLKVVAEGVENKQSLDLLNAMNCDFAQGYYLSKPLTAEELKDFINPMLQRVGL